MDALKILVVDDESRMRKLVKDFLTKKNFQVLEAGDGEDIELPPEVKITEFLVKNGQEVKKGDPVAKIDKVSALTAVTEIRTSMAAVEKQMETFSDEKSFSGADAQKVQATKRKKHCDPDKRAAFLFPENHRLFIVI